MKILITGSTSLPANFNNTMLVSMIIERMLGEFKVDKYRIATSRATGGIPKIVSRYAEDRKLDVYKYYTKEVNDIVDKSDAAILIQYNYDPKVQDVIDRCVKNGIPTFRKFIVQQDMKYNFTD